MPHRRGDGRAGLSSEGSQAGYGPLAKAFSAPDEDLGGIARVVQCSLLGGLLDEARRVVACEFGLVEDGGQGRPGGVGQDAFGVVGYGLADLVSEPFGCRSIEGAVLIRL